MRRQLALTVLAVTTMVTVAFLLPLAILVREVVADRALSAAEQEARSLAGVLGAVSDRTSTAAVLDQFNAGSPRRAAILLADGTAIGAPVPLPPEELEAAREGRAFTFSFGSDRVVIVPVRNAEGGLNVAAVAVPGSELRRGVTTAWAVLLGLGIALVALGVILADRMARATVRSIERLGEVTRRLRRGELDARAGPGGPPEVADIARAVNELAEQIEVLLASEREAAADLSHRLRTPLTALRLQVEGVRDARDRERLATGVDQLTGEVTAVIEAARRPRAVHTPDREADLGEVVDKRVAFWFVLARQQRRPSSWECPPEPVPVAVSTDELVAAIDALLANVFHHTPEGTAFRVAVTSSDGGSCLVVEDDGPGLPRASLATRGRSGAGSTGLGLDIVRRTAERSGGRLTLARAPSGGARVEVSFGRPSSDGAHGASP